MLRAANTASLEVAGRGLVEEDLIGVGESGGAWMDGWPSSVTAIRSSQRTICEYRTYHTGEEALERGVKPPLVPSDPISMASLLVHRTLSL